MARVAAAPRCRGILNKQVFIREMYLTRAGRAIFNLQNRFHWPVEPSTFTDEHKFKSYRIVSVSLQWYPRRTVQRALPAKAEAAGEGRRLVKKTGGTRPPVLL